MEHGYNNLPEIIAKINGAIVDGLNDGIAMLESETKQSMADAKGGRIYKSSKSGKAHRASAPREPPAIDTGALVNSIATMSSGQYKRIIATSQEYANHLEFGTPGGKIAARPFMRPAAIKLGDKIIDHISHKVNQATEE